jgi:hypothetical protein
MARIVKQTAPLFVALAGLCAAPALAQSTYPTPAGGRVAGVVSMVCDVNYANCVPAAAGVVGSGVDAAGNTLVVEVPSASPTVAGTTQFASSSAQATAGNVVIKASAGNLYGISAVGGAGAGFLMVFNSATVPVDGAVSPVICIPLAIGAYADVNLRGQPSGFTAGISVAYSSTGCFTKTAAAAGFFRADYR